MARPGDNLLLHLEYGPLGNNNPLEDVLQLAATTPTLPIIYQDTFAPLTFIQNKAQILFAPQANQVFFTPNTSSTPPKLAGAPVIISTTPTRIPPSSAKFTTPFSLDFPPPSTANSFISQTKNIPLPALPSRFVQFSPQPPAAPTVFFVQFIQSNNPLRFIIYPSKAYTPSVPPGHLPIFPTAFGYVACNNIASAVSIWPFYILDTTNA